MYSYFPLLVSYEVLEPRVAAGSWVFRGFASCCYVPESHCFVEGYVGVHDRSSDILCVECDYSGLERQINTEFGYRWEGKIFPDFFELWLGYEDTMLSWVDTACWGWFRSLAVY